ncbi:TRAP transporter small permease [Desulfofundulus thermosubterraneus]|uniref:TRAP-type C4-dicarboxylate transport system, small permease component n=1 Tax=Desulfofundulus thermosubterraneus DSM 16057 TaxID=1121432 RepID=A0A1M6M4Z2_9FIRM|nr:TRAP transporter small permease [Desulfofundulus thermosubterraneus]SHJ78496.1 TRAP-type C4-dicarboxylate transport system, small permease component [Desulfofundulus thermosubterraneus DSM 16057]
MIGIIQKIGRGAEKLVEYLLFASLGGMVFLVFVNAVLRYIFNEGFAPSEELARYLFVWAVFLGAITAYKDNKHIAVNLITARLKGLPKKIIELAGYMLVLVAAGVMFKGGLEFTQQSISSLGPATGIPFSFITFSYVLATVFIGAMTLGRIVNVIRKGGV